MSLYVSLQSVGTSIDAADALFNAKRWEDATKAYQAAGNQAMGLQLIAGGASGLNQQLQALQWKLATQATAVQAQSLSKQILALYTQAYGNSPRPPAPTKATPLTKTTGGVNWLLWGIALIGVGALGYFMIKGPGVNPTSGGKGPRGRKLVSKGHSCIFEMVDGRDISTKGGMLHDPSGKTWPSRSVLIGPFRGGLRKADPDEVDAAAKHYLGSSHPAKIGMVDTPPKDLTSWTYVGDVENILYTRTGRRRPGRYEHPFNKSWVTLFTGKKRVKLYRRGRYYRLQLPRGAILDSRGFVVP